MKHGRPKAGKKAPEQDKGADVIEVAGRKFFTAAGVAALLGMNEQTIRRYLNRGLIHGNRIADGKKIIFSEQDVADFLNGKHKGKSGKGKP